MRALFVILLTLVAGCSSVTTTVATTDQLLRRAGDPSVTRAERQEAIKELIERRDRPIASDFSTIAERHLHEARTAQVPENASRSSEVGLDVVDALVSLGARSTAVLSLRLADADSELVRSKPALERFSKHEDGTVRDMAKAALARHR